MLYIFGYGSLIAPIGINGRNMSRQYTNDDLIETYLHNYAREWNATIFNKTFLGLIHKPNSLVNGVIFPINQNDLEPFKHSEYIFNFEDSNIPSLYSLVDVTNDIVTKLNPNDRILTCVTVSPNTESFIPNYYLHILKDCLEYRSEKFNQEFERTL